MKWTSDDVNERPQTLRYKLGFACEVEPKNEYVG
jgi:hypothetical protein